ncbi:MAG: hypothetical protein S4CHLAM123_07100 [Chlamydiales bacterium]|nr:hypothetical protein [Chlamydiales bacterium]
MSKLLKQQETSQLKWGSEVFSNFLFYLEKRGLITLSQLQDFTQTLKTPDLTENKLNQIISFVNALNPKQTPFPEFSYINQGHERSSVLNLIDMVQRVLTEIAEAKVVNWDLEESDFIEVAQLFAKLEQNELKPKEALAKLLFLIEKFNKQLPSESLFPLLDLRAYESY